MDITASGDGDADSRMGLHSRPGRPPLTIAEVGAQATAGIEEITLLMKDIRNGRGTVGKLFTDDGVYRDLNTLLQSADRVVSQIANGRGTLGRLTNDPALYNELSVAVADLRTRHRRGSAAAKAAWASC